MELREKIANRLDFIYKGSYSSDILDRLCSSVNKTKELIILNGDKWNEKDTVLITYGDSLKDGSETPLKVLNNFLQNYLQSAISYVHILPFFPYSSDDGFSVIDYYKVNPDVGEWNDVKKLSEHYKIMFDLVINHISQHSAWFQNYLKGINPGKEFFIEVDPQEDLSKVVRPRSLPLLSEYQTVNGKKHVWTTFSADQIDINFGNPELLAEMIDIFLFYLQQGASMIRLDAIAFLWKEIGTNCLHLPETHEFVKLLHDISDYISEGLILLTETNVPNKENLSYFGNNDEANMVYQFSLPPLLLHSLHTANSKYLTEWAKTIPLLQKGCTFFNFTASHDGIGVRPLEGLLPKDEFDTVISGMKKFGGKISTKRNSDGTDSPYEINITYFDAMKGTKKGEDEWQEARFLCSQTIMMEMMGVPAFYIHSLLGTHNYLEGVEQTGMNRTINRRKWEMNELKNLLSTDTEHSRVIKELKRRIEIRQMQAAFHPEASQEIIDMGDKVFMVSRNSGELLAVSNVTKTEHQVHLPSTYTELNYDIISGLNVEVKITLKPYQTMWLINK